MIRICFCVFFLFPVVIFSQNAKPQIDTSDFKAFKTLMYTSADITDDGRYMAYRKATSLQEGESIVSIVCKSVNSNWQMTIDSISGPYRMTANSKYLVYRKLDRSLNILKLGSGKIEAIQGVDNFSLMQDRESTMICYTIEDKNLILLNVENKKKLALGNYIAYEYAPSSRALVQITREGRNNCIYSVGITTGLKSLIWKGYDKVEKLIFDNSGYQLAFLIDTNLWYCRLNSKVKPRELKLPSNEDFVGLTNLFLKSFSDKGNLIFFSLIKPLPQIENPNNIDVYSYLDGKFEMGFEHGARGYQFCYDIRSGKFVRIEYANEEMRSISDDERRVLISSQEGSREEYYWNKKSQRRDYVLNIETKEKQDLFNSITHFLCPSGEFVVGVSKNIGDIICRDLSSGVDRNLTSKLPIPIFDNFEETLRSSKSRSLNFIAFLDGGKKVLIRDRYDLWILSSKNESEPICITNGFGRKTRISFKPLENSIDINKNMEIILSAFNEDNKESGFYKVKIAEKKDPELLSMGAFYYDGITKAKNNNVWVMKRMSAKQAPNFFSTTNFKDFKTLSEVHPENNFNWFSTELITYTTKKGVVSQAMLYKPDNFDSTKKYPVLFNFYEKESFKLNYFLLPNYTSHFYYNIPLMLSRGYMVCVPDIQFTIGETAASIVDCVEGAAEVISTRSYIDSTRYGASGGSFGGYGVNCLAAFSNRFKGIASISGRSDLLSGYGEAIGTGAPNIENKQYHLGISLSTDPHLYMRNSPIAFARDVVTPLLIVIGKNDVNVNIQQGIEWFISLRREGKQAWLIHYNNDESNHGIWGNDEKDLYARLNQFFDHYLKGAATPKWMLDSLPIRERSNAEGQEFMPQGVVPGAGLNTEDDLQRKSKYLKVKRQQIYYQQFIINKLKYLK